MKMLGQLFAENAQRPTLHLYAAVLTLAGARVCRAVNLATVAENEAGPEFLGIVRPVLCTRAAMETLAGTCIGSMFSTSEPTPAQAVMGSYVEVLPHIEIFVREAESKEFQERSSAESRAQLAKLHRQRLGVERTPRGRRAREAALA